jgi:hypothetical protein
MVWECGVGAGWRGDDARAWYDRRRTDGMLLQEPFRFRKLRKRIQLAEDHGVRDVKGISLIWAKISWIIPPQIPFLTPNLVYM